jgi:hypothetical protein
MKLTVCWVNPCGHKILREAREAEHEDHSDRRRY